MILKKKSQVDVIYYDYEINVEIVTQEEKNLQYIVVTLS